MTDNLDTPTDSTSSGSTSSGSTPADTVPADTVPASNGAGAAPTSTAIEDRPAEPPKKKGINRAAVEWVVLIVAAIVIAIVIKTFLFQAFYIPSESMVPTLEVGDRVLVNKLSYDLHDVNRGDIIVFAAEPNAQWRTAGIDDLVKRIIAMPGETITECQTGKVCINDRVLNESYLPKGTTTTFDSTPPGCEPDSPPNGCTVPAGHYFVLGDNRGKSADARIHGPIKGSSIVGRVFVRIWPLDRLGFL